MSTVVLLGGAAATGKSSVAAALLARHPGLAARPSESFFRLAAARGVPLADAFDMIPAEEAEDDYLTCCAATTFTVSELHYAIQPQRDSAYAVGQQVDYCGEAYIGSVSSRLLDAMASHRVILALLVAPAQVVFARACSRDGARRRALSIVDAQRELDAEYREFQVVSARPNVLPVVLDSSACTVAQIVDEIERLV